jgi:acyl carrier protein
MNKVESLLNEILCDLTGEARAFPLDGNFADLGIDSFHALRLVRAIEDRTGHVIEVHALFDHPTIGELARWLAALPAPADAVPGQLAA